MITQLLTLAGAALIGASVVVIIIVTPHLGAAREKWLRTQRRKRALERNARATEDATIAFTELGTAVTNIGTSFISALAAALTPTPENTTERNPR